MPIYRLLCEDCNKTIERLCIIDEYVKCGKVMKRLPVQTSFILKGDGWAEDGYTGGGNNAR